MEHRMAAQPSVRVRRSRRIQMRQNAVNVRPRVLWPIVEPFEYWCLPVYPCAKLSLQLLKKVMIYARESEYFPHLSLKNWIHICKYKLKFSEEYAWMYIRLFDVVRQHMCRDDDEFSYWDRKCDTFSQIKKDRWKELSVPTLEFLLFLYIQHSFRIMNKTKKNVNCTPVTEQNRQNSSQTEYPNGWLYPPDMGNNYVLGELNQLNYLKHYLNEIMDFLQLSDKSSLRVSVDIVSTLNLIIGGALYRSGGATLLKLEEFLCLPDVSKSVDFDYKDNTVDRGWFVEWIQLKLRLYPLGTTSCLKKCQSESINTGTWESGAFSIPLNRIGGNGQPPPQAWFIISQVNEQVLCRDDLTPFSNLKIHRCNNSYIYVPAVFSNVVIEKCHNTTVYLGCVSKILRFVECNRCYFIGQGRQVVIHECLTTQFNLHTPCQIIMSGLHTSELIFGPYATFYPKLREHMVMAHLGAEPSHWHKIVGVADPEGQPMETDHRWDFLAPQEFFEFGYPFTMEGETTYNPVKLPKEYVKYKSDVKAGFLLWKKHVESANLDPASQRLVHETMYERFKYYLEFSDFDFELDGLKSLVPQNLDKKNWICEVHGEAKQNSSYEESFSEESDRSVCTRRHNQSQQNSPREVSSSEESVRSVCLCRNNRSLETLSQAVNSSIAAEISLSDSDHSDIESNSEEEDGEVFLFTEHFLCESEYDSFMKRRIAELVSRPLSADFDASGSGIEDVQFDFFSDCDYESSLNLSDST